MLSLGLFEPSKVPSNLRGICVDPIRVVLALWIATPTHAGTLAIAGFEEQIFVGREERFA